MWCFCFPSSTPGWSCVYFRTPRSLTLWFILTPNRAPPSICFLCFRYLLIFQCVRVRVAFFLDFFFPYLDIFLCFFGWFPAAVFDVNCLRAFATPSFDFYAFYAQHCFEYFRICFTCTCFYAISMYYTLSMNYLAGTTSFLPTPL